MRECQQSISSDEFAEWMAFFQLEPFGDQRADLRNGVLCAILVNLLSKDGKADPNQFANYLEHSERPEPEKMPTDVLRSRFEMFTKLHNASVSKRNG